MLLRGLFRKDNPFDYIVLGFIMKLIGNFSHLFISYHIGDAFFGLLSWCFIIKGFSLIPGRLRFPFKGLYGWLVKFFLLICLILIIRGYTIDYGFLWFTTIGAINYHLFQPTYLICYLMPFVAFIPIRYYNFRLAISYSYIFILITVCSFIFFYQEIIQNSLLQAAGFEAENDITAQSLSFCSSFAFLTLLYRYIPSNTWKANLIGLVICLLLMVIGARRGGTMMNLILLAGAFYFYYSAKRGASKISNAILISIIVIVGFALITNSQMSTYLQERGLEDSRSNVDEALLSQMSNTELIFGKGLNGRYYHPLMQDDYLKGWRYGTETGFYNLVLKGGYLLAFTYILLLIIPTYKGLFKSKNLFCKTGGFYILYHLISLFPFGILTFDLRFFFLWIFIVCCMNKTVRRMSDEEIRTQFFYNLK